MSAQWHLLEFEWPARAADLPRPEGLTPTYWRPVSGGLGRLYLDHAPKDPAPWSALQPLLSLAGAAAGQHAGFHYVVETDIPAEVEQDFNDWYEQEHMPGLARVSGTIATRRFRRVNGQPVYVACYDLVSPAALEHPDWLAVRYTPWSDRIRPHFRNTRRMMFERHS